MMGVESVFMCVFLISFIMRANGFKGKRSGFRIEMGKGDFKRASLMEGDVDDSSKSAQIMEGVNEEFGENEDEGPISEKMKNKLLIDKSTIYTVAQDDYIVVGTVLTTYGLKGHVKVKSYSSQPEIRLCEPGYRYLKIPFNEERVIPIKIERGRPSARKDVYIVKFEGFDTVDQSQRLTNAHITIPLFDVPPLEEDTYYSRDLMNLDLYLYNDVNKTKLGKIVGFVHRSDLACKKKYEEICEDLIEVQMDMKVSLKTLIKVSNESKMNKELEGTTETESGTGTAIGSSNEKKEKQKGKTIITERELEEADEVVDMYEEFERPHFKSLLYVKYYECSKCGKEFTNHTMGLLHEKEHENDKKTIEEEKEIIEKNKNKLSQNDCYDYSYDNNDSTNNSHHNINIGNSNNKEEKTKVVSIDEIIESEKVVPLRRFYVPLIKDETVKYIDVQNKSVYVDPYTIFIGEDPNYK